MTSGRTRTVDARVPTSHPLPLVDVVAHARAEHARSGHRRTNIITTATIYGAAVLATGGFVVAAVVDELLRLGRPSPRPGRAPAASRRVRGPARR